MKLLNIILCYFLSGEIIISLKKSCNTVLLWEKSPETITIHNIKLNFKTIQTCRLLLHPTGRNTLFMLEEIIWIDHSLDFHQS